jgi:hypothetical protein
MTLQASAVLPPIPGDDRGHPYLRLPGATGATGDVDSEARREYDALLLARARPEKFEPLIVGRPAYPSEIPTGARDFEIAMIAAGFKTKVIYSKGTRIHAKLGTPLKGLTDAISVRCRRVRNEVGDADRVVGLWYKLSGHWTVQGGWFWPEGTFPKNYGVDAVRGMVKL